MNWKAQEIPSREAISSIMKSLNIGEELAILLIQRGIEDFDTAKKFFRPRIEDLHDPFLMKDMEKAIIRIEEALANNHKIMIYGDYDVDGTTAVSLVYQFFSQHSSNIIYYIPDRYKEGYGVSFQGIDYAAQNGVSLIIALDCGIKSNYHVEYAAAKKVDFIICDHHLPGEKIPAAIAVLDPKRPDCEYPFKELSGCGIGFKLCQAFIEKNNLDPNTLYQYLDLVCISIASDIVQIADENRVLAYFGLKKLSENPCVGLNALMEFYTRKKEYTISDIVFSLGPRINAAGRIADANAAVRLLIEKDPNKVADFAKVLNDRNLERREFDSNITEEALKMIDTDPFLKASRSTVVYNENWHKGVVGIVASRLIEKHYRPTIVLTESEGKLTGSARSVKGFDVHAAIEACSHLLLQFGGHTHAAGLSLEPAKFTLFREEFEKIVSSTISEDSLTPCINYDLELIIDRIDDKFWRILKQFSPFGPGNMNPVFMSSRVKDTGLAKIVGNNHLKLNITQGAKTIPAIAFGMGEYLEKIKGKNFDILYHIEENFYNNVASLQLMIKDIKV